MRRKADKQLAERLQWAKLHAMLERMAPRQRDGFRLVLAKQWAADGVPGAAEEVRDIEAEIRRNREVEAIRLDLMKNNPELTEAHSHWAALAAHSRLKTEKQQ